MDAAEQIREFIRENFFVEAFGDGDSFLKNGIVDSIGVLQIINFIEQRFGVPVEETELLPENLDSVENIVGFLARKRPTALRGT